ncbi:Huntingtin, partial [Ophiophagus hannah]
MRGLRCRNSPEFPKLLGIAMELFLLCSDDAESDVRMVSDECLNKVIKVLLKAFIGNLNSNSPTIRRTAAAATVSICQHSRRTQYFYTRLLQVLLGKGLLCPKEEEHPSVLILGVLLTLRYLIPLLQQQVKDTSLKGSFGVYELSLHYTQHRDHNVVTGSLELLQQLLRTPPPNLLLSLTMRGGLLHAGAAKDEIVSRSRSDSIVELIAKVLSGEESLEDDSEAKSETSQMGFAGSVKSELNSELTSTSGISPAASSASDPPGCDIITEQPRSQHVLQSESEISACDLTGTTPKADTDDDILSRSSSQISAIQSDLLKLQDRVLKEVVISLLGDEDPRVRRVAAAALVRLVPKLYSSCDTGQADPVVALAKEQSSIYLKLLMHETPPASQFAVSTITRTYRGYNLVPSPADVTVTLDLQNINEKFGAFLRSALDVLSQILELATLQDIGKLLKTLFGTNLASQFDSWSSNSCRAQGKCQRLGSSNLRPGLYHCCFMAPYTQFTQALADASLRNMMQAEQESDTSGWFDILQKVSAQLKTGTMNMAKHRADKNIIHNHIRLFEPLVIKALKQYTTTTSVQLQRQVLDLLAQLVQLRVFIGFVLKQFEYIEVGQFRESEAIIPSVFFFLVLLSYERYHSKQIIGIPKIIQLCDGIMASGRKAVTHAIPALQPIVHDLFILRGANKADAGKELETQKEVVVSMLLRLIQYHQASVSTVQLWVSGILAILRVLISQSTEDIVLSRIQELSFSPHLISCQTIHRLRNGGNKIPPTQEIPTDEQDRFLPEETFSRFFSLVQPTAVKKTLQCLEGIHLSQSGAVLVLYVDKLLSTPFRVLAHMVDTLACRRVEMLLAASVQNSTAQLPVEELDRIQEYLQNAGLAHRSETCENCFLLLGSFQDFNISLLAPCLSLGGQELSRGLRSHFEAARLVTLHQVTEVALSQYLVLLSKLPASLRIPPEKENDVVKFVVMLLEQVPLSMDLQAVLDCCCLALQQTELWNLWASAENSSQASSLIHCTRFILVAVAIEPGNRLLSPEKRKKIQKATSENEKGSQTPNSENITATCEVVAELVECLQSVLALGHKKNSPIPAFLTPILRNIIISLSRLPLVNSYARVPLLVYMERTQINVLAVQAITSLVLSAMTIPLAGNPAVSCLEQQPRNKTLKALDTSITPLREEEWGEDEDDESDMPALTSPPSSPINSRKHRAGVDIHSCSQFLLELYSQWILPSSPNKKTPVTLISEVVRSDKAVAEPVSRLLESTLRNAHMPSRIGALHGILYILECDLLDETAKQLIPVITEYLLSNLRGVAHCVNLHNQQHILVMCAVAFYLIENYPADMCGLMLSENEGSTPSVIYHCVLRGLERLLLSEQLSQPDCEALVKLSVDRVNVLSPHRAMAALGLMLSCMYTGLPVLAYDGTVVHGPGLGDVVALQLHATDADRHGHVEPFLLPHIISRMGKSEQVDLNLFCLVAIDFYRHQIDEELDRRAFQSIFEVVSSPGNPYHRLLTCLQSVHKITPC